jgi:hypothetical protein
MFTLYSDSIPPLIALIAFSASLDAMKILFCVVPWFWWKARGSSSGIW